MAKNNILEQIRQAVSNFGNKVESGVQNFMTDLPANSAYLQAITSRAIAPKFVLPTVEKQQEEYTLSQQAIDGLRDLPTKTMSASLSEWPVAPDTPYNQKLEQQKQQILNSGVFRPAMARYLSTVPVWGGYDNPGGGLTQMSLSQGYNVPQIDVNQYSKETAWENYDSASHPDIQMGITPEQTSFNIDPPSQFSSLEPVMAHELIHAAPRNNSLRDSFNIFFRSVSPNNNPLLYNTGLTYLKNGQMPPNAEEFYTTIAQQMGPNVLKIPEVKKYFQNIFQ